jgi:hypothetical protein
MEIKEAKKIYFELVQNYNLFNKETTWFGTEHSENYHYLTLGLIPEIASTLSDGKDIIKLVEEIRSSIKNYWEFRTKSIENMNTILSDQYLTSKEKDQKASELKKEIALNLNDLVKANAKLASKQEKVFTPIFNKIQEVTEVLGEFGDNKVLPSKINLYANCPECTEKEFTNYFVDELYTPYPPLKDRDFNYFIRIGEEVSFTRHVEEEFEELGIQTLSRHLTNFKAENYWKENGFSSKVEWLASVHEKRKEAEELAYIEDVKMQQALKELKAQGKQEGFFKKMLGAFTNE